MTRFEKIKKMTVEEFAETFMDIYCCTCAKFEIKDLVCENGRKQRCLQTFIDELNMEAKDDAYK